jgi:urease beta subunit
MISQLANIQAFVTKQLIDVIDWGRDVRPDSDHKTTGDAAYIVIKTAHNRYKLAVLSSYIDPPAGAPVECRSLGTVIFDDPADSKHIVGPKSDAVYAQISKHVHVREYTDALAAVRRELAEAPLPTKGEDGSVKYDPAQAARVKLADLVAKAKVWGIEAAIPKLSPAIQDAGCTHSDLAKESAGILVSAPAAPQPSLVPPLVLVGGGEKPWLGMPVLFITNPAEQISGMQHIPGTCVKVLSDDRISIFMTPDHSEPSYRDGLPRRGSPAGNGRVHQYNCWDVNPEFTAFFSRMRDAEMRLRDLEKKDDGAQTKMVADLLRRIEALEVSAAGAAKPTPDKAKKVG